MVLVVAMARYGNEANYVGRFCYGSMVLFTSAQFVLLGLGLSLTKEAA